MECYWICFRDLEKQIEYYAISEGEDGNEALNRISHINPHTKEVHVIAFTDLFNRLKPNEKEKRKMYSHPRFVILPESILDEGARAPIPD